MTRRDRRAVLDRIEDGGVVAVLRGVDAGDAGDVGAALRDGGITALEVTMDAPGATDAVAALASAPWADDVVVGAGTVLDPETAGAAVRAGAEFVVAPNTDEAVIEACNRRGVACVPGALTPTEAVDAYRAGADAVKVFPASTVGPGHLRALAGPLPQIPLVPTGGIGLADVEDFLAAGALAVGVGSALVDDDAVAAGDFDAVTETARTFAERVEAAR